jgi:hypothetical protein
MSKSLNNRSFGVNKEPIDAGNYIEKKKARVTYCNSNVCIKKNPGTYENYNLLNKAQQLDKYNCYLPFDKYDLNINLFTKIEIYTQSNSTIDPLLNIYDNYNIDPNGVLFGNTLCNKNKYLNFTFISQ